MNNKIINNVNDNNNNFERIQVNLKLNKNIAQVGRLIAKYYESEDFDKFISEEVSKIIFSISESSSTILIPPPISDELKQQIHKLLLEGENGIIMTSPQKMIDIIYGYISSIQPFHYPHLYYL